jgi:tRNA1(Val) A37 N6-methylase TrmN6
MVMIMEYLPNGYCLETPDGTFPLSTDSMLLSHFVRLPKNASVLDLGSGCGTLGVLLCASDPGCSVTGVELSESAHAAAEANIARNQLQRRMHSICADLRCVSLVQGSFQVCVSNPPYFSGGPASRDNPLARREDFCSPAELFAVAAKALKFGGDFFLVHKPERLAELIACGAKKHLEAKRLLLVRHRQDGPIALLLLQFRKGGKPGLKIEEAFLHDTDGAPSTYYKEVYHIP